MGQDREAHRDEEPQAGEATEEPRILFEETTPRHELTGETSWLVFRFGERTAAIVAEDVVEVFSLDNITPVPRSPRSVLGITNLRGTISPVVDLISLFKEPPPPWRSNKFFCILIRCRNDSFVLSANEIIRIVLWPENLGTEKDETLGFPTVSWRGNSVLVLDKDSLHQRITEACREAFNRKVFDQPIR